MTEYIFIVKFGKIMDLLQEIDSKQCTTKIKIIKNIITIEYNKLLYTGKLTTKITHKYFPYPKNTINKKIKTIYELNDNLGYFIIYYDNSVLFEKYYPFYVNKKYQFSIYGRIILI